MREVVRYCRLDTGSHSVWDAVSDLSAMINWYPQAEGVEKLTGPDKGIGRIQRVRYRMGRRKAAIDSEIVEWRPAHLIVWRQVREFHGTKQAPLLADDILTRVTVNGIGESGETCDFCVQVSWVPVGLKGELAAETVVRPRTERFADNLVDYLRGRFGDLPLC